MKTISEHAREAILALNLIPAEDVGIQSVLDSSWNGTPPRILISEGENNIEECQFGAVAQTTLLTIFGLSADRDTAITLCRQAAKAAFARIESLERKPGYGILAITRDASRVGNIPDSTEFEAFRSFHVINTINL
ncbi:MAG: hypothetical protein LBQ54_10160 [Planctomycetaceae bacterium]|jgi:hypothetical protein|nr:hypothetical protein [Planctomycetaceae bacterium]